jgi:hypothetical protein|tara:strand:+ start:89 stop:481 length:393 start_codon:yes stop_codon:yes gene_type:complete
MKWFDKLTGKKEEVAQTPEGEFDELETNRRAALDLEKQEATRLGKAWVAVLDTQVNPENIKNGFFEIDWNNQFIEELLDAGYSGETNEEIVDGWFKTVVSQILEEGAESVDRDMGYINVVPIDKGKSEVS